MRGAAGCVSSSEDGESSCVTDAFFWVARDAAECVSSSESSLEEDSLESLKEKSCWRRPWQRGGQLPRWRLCSRFGSDDGSLLSRKKRFTPQ